MTTIQRVAQVFGWVFVAVALWGFLISGMSMEADPETAPAILGLFPVNVLHNLVHLGLGIWGIVASRTFSAARSYAIIAGGIYLVLAILGFIMPSGLGFVPLGGGDIWLHAILAVALLGFGLAAETEGSEAVRTTRRVETDRTGYTTGTTARPGRAEPAVGGAMAAPRRDEETHRPGPETRRDETTRSDAGTRRDEATRGDIPSSDDLSTRDRTRGTSRDPSRDPSRPSPDPTRDPKGRGPTSGSGGDPTR